MITHELVGRECGTRERVASSVEDGTSPVITRQTYPLAAAAARHTKT